MGLCLKREGGGEYLPMLLWGVFNPIIPNITTWNPHFGFGVFWG